MTPYYDSGDGRCVIYCGDCVDVMRDLPSESMQCVVTSPPYWGLRDYGVPGQIGLEPTMAEYVAQIVNTLGWQPACKCNAGVVPCTVLDPFSGSGTSGLVALRLGRRYIGIDLSADYLDMSLRRLEPVLAQSTLDFTEAPL